MADKKNSTPTTNIYLPTAMKNSSISGELFWRSAKKPTKNLNLWRTHCRTERITTLMIQPTVAMWLIWEVKSRSEKRGIYSATDSKSSSGIWMVLFSALMRKAMGSYANWWQYLPTIWVLLLDQTLVFKWYLIKFRPNRAPQKTPENIWNRKTPRVIYRTFDRFRPRWVDPISCRPSF